MKPIQSEIEYQAICNKIEELLKVVDNETPVSETSFIELNILSDLVADYEEKQLDVEA